jgi:3-dehydroquinate dehydratase-2
MRILVLHGPNLNLLDGERSLETIDARLKARASALGVELTTFQSNWEGALLDKLAELRTSFDALIVNPAVLAPNAAALAEAISLLKKPAIEVLLDNLKSGRSALKGVVKQQIYGKGAGGYLEALEALAPKGPRPKPSDSKTRDTAPMRAPVKEPERSEKTIGPAAQPRMQPNRPQTQKTIGPRKVAQGAAVETGGKTIGRRTASGRGGLTREDVRKRIAERLSGRLSPSGLATWARSQWQELQRGAPCETGQRDRLEDVLQSLLLSQASKATDEQLIDLMTQLG